MAGCRALTPEMQVQILLPELWWRQRERREVNTMKRNKRKSTGRMRGLSRKQVRATVVGSSPTASAYDAIANEDYEQ
jgi:hypothetical protein